MSGGQRVISDLHQLPRFEDGWTFLYADKVRIEREDYAIALVDETGRVPVPAASLSALMLGPGTTITHAAMVALAESGCSVIFCGEDGTRFYASGLGETRRAGNALRQAEAWADPREHLAVVQRMYRIRFSEPLDEKLTLEQIRGLEGVRVRDAYAAASAATGVAWSGRAYTRGDWSSADPVNRALSTANACLYALCHAAIASAGFHPALGFVHTGKMLSFVYDVADLYKVDVTVPIAFDAAAAGASGVESRARRACRTAIWKGKLLERIIPDIQRVLGLRPERVRALAYTRPDDDPNADDAGSLWDDAKGAVGGGRNFGGGETA